MGLIWKKFGRFGSEKVDFKGNGVIYIKVADFEGRLIILEK